VTSKEYQTRGTWSTCNDYFTRRIVLITSMYFFSLYLFQIK
jgi:hypothetical protein